MNKFGFSTLYFVVAILHAYVGACLHFVVITQVFFKTGQQGSTFWPVLFKVLTLIVSNFSFQHSNDKFVTSYSEDIIAQINEHDNAGILLHWSQNPKNTIGTDSLAAKAGFKNNFLYPAFVLCYLNTLKHSLKLMYVAYVNFSYKCTINWTRNVMLCFKLSTNYTRNDHISRAKFQISGVY